MKRFLVIIALILLLEPKANACTSAIITGRATPDGRPLMWKHRDTGEENNRIVYIFNGKYAYIGLVNSSNINNNEIWSGTNSAGFCIMNTASYNIKNKADTTKFEDREGIVMRLALENCATISDFEKLLDTISKPIGIEANFGVIDAYGGAAYYEANNFSYNKYDANDTTIAPDGYLIRTNYSVSGRNDEGMGYIRSCNATYLFDMHKTEKFTPEWIFSSASRSYYHSILDEDLRKTLPRFAIDQDYIPRKISSAAIVFQGVVNGENAEHTTMWTVLGFPPCSVAVPLWVAGGPNLPEMMVAASNNENAPLCNKVVALKNKVFPIKRGNGGKYMNFELLYNANNTGIIQKLASVEQQIFAETYKKMEHWNKKNWNKNDIEKYYKELNSKVENAYNQYFGL